MARTYEENLAERRRLYNERIEWGLCVRCGAPLKCVKTHYCAACLEKNRAYQHANRERIREYQRERYHRRAADHKARGLCVYCDAPATRGNLCEYHFEYYKNANRKKGKYKKCR